MILEVAFQALHELTHLPLQLGYYHSSCNNSRLHHASILTVPKGVLSFTSLGLSGACFSACNNILRFLCLGNLCRNIHDGEYARGMVPQKPEEE
jgi:hypothetical protein